MGAALAILVAGVAAWLVLGRANNTATGQAPAPPTGPTGGPLPGGGGGGGGPFGLGNLLAPTTGSTAPATATSPNAPPAPTPYSNSPGGGGSIGALAGAAAGAAVAGAGGGPQSPSVWPQMAQTLLSVLQATGNNPQSAKAQAAVRVFQAGLSKPVTGKFDKNTRNNVTALTGLENAPPAWP